MDDFDLVPTVPSGYQEIEPPWPGVEIIGWSRRLVEAGKCRQDCVLLDKDHVHIHPITALLFNGTNPQIQTADAPPPRPQAVVSTGNSCVELSSGTFLRVVGPLVVEPLKDRGDLLFDLAIGAMTFALNTAMPGARRVLAKLATLVADPAERRHDSIVVIRREVNILGHLPDLEITPPPIDLQDLTDDTPRGGILSPPDAAPDQPDKPEGPDEPPRPWDRL